MVAAGMYSRSTCCSGASVPGAAPASGARLRRYATTSALRAESMMRSAACHLQSMEWVLISSHKKICSENVHVDRWVLSPYLARLSYGA